MSRTHDNYDDNLEAFVDSNRDVLDFLEKIWSDDGLLPDSLASANKETAKVLTSSETIGAVDEQIDTSQGRLPVREDLPRRIGRFLIRSLLGRGGFGMVFLAHDPQLKRDIALKIPRPEAVMTDELRSRFVREAETCALLNHAHIVPVFEAGNYGLMCYIVSAWCDGPTLTQWCRENETPPVRQTVEMVLPLCDAIQHAHIRGVIHRDLKPDNILVERTPATQPNDGTDFAATIPKLLVTDFGLARPLDATSEITQDGSVIGTPTYMAPEQVNSELGTIGTAADIYSLGATLYSLLCGQPPIKGQSLLETIKLVQEKTPSQPSAINPQVHRDLDAICLKCLEKDAARRYSSASELQADLLRHLNGMPVLARQPTFLDRTLLWCRRRPVTAGLAAALLMVLALSSIVLSVLLARSNSLKMLSDQNATKAVVERDRARRAIDSMTSGVASSWLGGQKQLSAEQKKFISETIAYYRDFAASEVSTSEDQFWVAQAEHRLSRLFSRLGQFDEATLSVDRAIELLESIPTDWDHESVLLELTRALIHKEHYFRQTGKIEESLNVALKAAEIARELVDSGSDDDETPWKLLSQALGDAGSMLRRLNRLDESLPIMMESISIKERLAELNPGDKNSRRQLGISYMNMGNLLTQMKQTDQAEAFLKKSLAVRQALSDENPESARLRSDLGWTLDNLGGLAHHQQNFERAKAYYGRTVELRRELAEQFPLEESHSRNLVYSLFNLSVVAREQRDFEDAMELLRDVVRIASRGIADFPSISEYRIVKASAEMEQAKLLVEQEDADDAISVLEGSEKDLQWLLDRQLDVTVASRILGDLYCLKASTLSELERHDEAIDYWNSAIAAANPGDVNSLRLSRATSLVKRGDYEQAIADVASVLAATESIDEEQQDFHVFYNSACVFALLAERESNADKSSKNALRAIDLLKKAIVAGFQPDENLRSDSDLQSLREYPEFQALYSK